MKANEIRQSFINYFCERGHKHLPSSSLVPIDDPTLLFANAGMNQFKDEFTGASNPKNKRAVTIQKCVRAGGKHNDLENVGFTSRHHTFFEMMGNFSFGDYFKKEAIQMGWEFLTKELKLPKDKLYVTVHDSDQEAADIWHNQEGVPKDRIFFMGDKDNFWEMGEVGPCGPCSEIFYDHGIENADPHADISECILADENRYVEIWNLVFMQYEKYKEDGEVKRRALPKPSVDTGAGLERVAAAMQGVYNNFDGDLFEEIIKAIEQISGKKYTDHPQWMRVVSDHARSATMLLADGIIPSNEGRGYVLRRIIRRAVRYLDLLEVKDTQFYTLVGSVFNSLGDLYKDARKNKEFVEKYLKLEEESFRKTLASGLKLLEKKIVEMRKLNIKTLKGSVAFTLYDTHGFPVDLTEMILRENGYELDHDGFDVQMKMQKDRSKKSGDFSVQEDNSKAFYKIKESRGDTEFCGYDQLEVETKLLNKVAFGKNIALVFDKTCFYAEGGGQQGDCGEILKDGSFAAEILDTKKPVDGIIAHIVSNDYDFEIGKIYKLIVDKKARNSTTCNHTATHLLQAALIEVLGKHIKQAGSNVTPTRLRFDFTHPESLTKKELKEVERLVNAEIRKQVLVIPAVMTKDEAMKMGAMALFGEKYGNEVRVIDIPGFSTELCGGTHVSNTADIGFFKILSESSLATGVRRIEAVSNVSAYDYLNEKIDTLEILEAILKSKGDTLVTKVEQMQDSVSSKNKEIKILKEKLQTINAKSMFDSVDELKDGSVFKHINANADDDIRKLGDLFMDKYPKGMVLITSAKATKASVLLKTFKGNENYKCSDILKTSMAVFGGKGGGKPEMAQGSIGSEHKEGLIKEILGQIQK